MTLDPAAVEVARRSRAEQGLPPKVTDPAVLAQAARLIVRAPTDENEERPA